MKSEFKILVINPGSLSTKIALFLNDECKISEELLHKHEDLAAFGSVFEQMEYRSRMIEDFLDKNHINLSDIDAIVGRGGLMKPVRSGTYEVCDEMINDLKNSISRWGMEHAANLGAPLAKLFKEKIYKVCSKDVPAFVVDPISTDDFEPIAKISGIPDEERKTLSHALNIRAVGRLTAKDLGKAFEEVNLVGAHLGGGITVAAIKKGKNVDTNVALLGYGPFSPQRAGTLAISTVMKLCFSGKYDQKSLMKKLGKESGLYGYLKTDSGIEVEKRIREGDKFAELVYHAMVYTVAKEIGAMATVLKGEIDAIFITGGLARSELVVNWLKEYISFLAPVIKIYPGEREMQAMAEGALRVLSKSETVQKYG